MTDLPSKRTKTRTVHEWAIATPCDAKTFSLSLRHIHIEMGGLGVDLGFDDAYYVRVADDEVVFYVEVENDADPS